MKLERAHEYVTTTLAIAGGMVLAYVFGQLAGTGRFGLVAAALGGLGFIGLLLTLREQVWLLIPASALLSGQIDVLPGHPALRDLSTLLVFASIFALTAFKVIRRKPRYEFLDFLMVALLVYVLTVFIRNPTGGAAIGSDRVGGRPYLDTIVATLAYWVLSRVALHEKLARPAFFVSLTLGLASSLSVVAQTFFPKSSAFLGPIFGVSASEDADVKGPPGEEDRKFYLNSLGNTVANGLVCLFPPLSLLNPLRPGRFFGYAAALLCILLSGFRSSIVGAGLQFVVLTQLTGGVWKSLRVCFLGVILLGVLLLMQGTIIQLPLGVQRSLSFLPGDWDRATAQDAAFSSTWRFEMWEQMLTTDRYIQSKWLGDGFGMTFLQLQQMNSTAAQNDPQQLQESFLVSGTVHSGPVGTIRFIGYIGLALFLALLFALSRTAWLLCRDARGTPFQAYVFYSCVGWITYPIVFVFIFGSLEADLPNAILGVGVMKMLRRSLNAYQARQQVEKATPEAEPALGGWAPPQPAHLRF